MSSMSCLFLCSNYYYALMIRYISLHENLAASYLVGGGSLLLRATALLRDFLGIGADGGGAGSGGGGTGDETKELNGEDQRLPGCCKGVAA